MNSQATRKPAHGPSERAAYVYMPPADGTSFASCPIAVAAQRQAISASADRQRQRLPRVRDRDVDRVRDGRCRGHVRDRLEQDLRQADRVLAQMVEASAVRRLRPPSRPLLVALDPGVDSPATRTVPAMRVAVFGDAHAHAEALDAVIAAAEEHGADELWSLGDMIGRGPDPEHVVARTRERCRVALMGNHDYAATGAAEPARFGEPGSPAVRSLELARERLPSAELDWMRSRRPAARRDGVQCWHGGPRNAVHEYVGQVQRRRVPRDPARAARPRRAHPPRGRVAPDAAGRGGRGEDPRRRAHPPGGQVAAQPGRGRRAGASRGVGWFADLDAQAADGAFWLLLDLDDRTATWRRAPYDPRAGAEARPRARDRRRLTQRGRSKRAK